MTAYLGVEQSLTGRRWVGPTDQEDRLAQSLRQQHDLPDMLARVLARLDVPATEVPAFLDPKLRTEMPDPSRLRDMDAATERLVAALKGRERVAVFGDYDVDGGASSALLLRWLRHFGLTPTLYVPDRIDEGYGPNEPAMAALGADHDLIICVDCGTLSIAPVAAARAAGADVIILDHHLGGEHLPDACAVVNPNRQDADGELDYLCAAGVVFLLLVSANRALRAAGTDGPDLLGLLDLVALATVADVAPLRGLNRVFVRQGLKVMAGRGRPGLVALADLAKMNSAPAAYHLGFLLGPRINAGGRIGKADLGARLLATDDLHEAQALAEELDRLNRERRDIEAAVLDAALMQAEDRGTSGPLVWAAGEGWHPGVVGIVAARLKEATNRPAVVIGLDGDEGKGSGRSISGVDLGSAIAACAREGVLLKGGGHKMAAGLTVARDQLEPAMDRLGALLARQGADRAGPQDLRLDGLLAARAATPELVEALDTAGPFGAGAPAPRVALSDMRIRFTREVGDGHLQVTFSDAEGGRIDAIAFRAMQGDLGPALVAHGGGVFHVAGRIEIDTWQGRRKVKLRLEDAAAAG
ncbi:single-stranded-DNA-specific exonuclease RecJ [Oceanomicrobium pacificus]|uniref:Single-stranded-DNA-specific exonuclease RecJ n=1 Tax=Oceanomicrobium pacificus TaxID=2692916 RepID=A0A6B0TUU8_9RHOB|nr:single-stranded-DNA-specific exonuclease RecJ [Oceanomicrobium pacificus]MXU65358.1 single-stranded-DNA-specific exonuclease RecJ [Oceanomicrobium pacificus]